MPALVEDIVQYPVGERLHAGRQRIPRDAQIPDGEVGEDLRETQQAIFGRDLPERRPVDRVAFAVDKDRPIAQMPQGNALSQEMRQGVFDQKKGIEIGRRDEQRRFRYAGQRSLRKQSLKMPLEPLRPTASANRRTEPVVFDRQPAEYDMGVFVEIAFHLGPDLFGHPIAALVIAAKETIQIAAGPMFRNRVQPADGEPFQHDGTNSRFGVGRSQFRCPATLLPVPAFDPLDVVGPTQPKLPRRLRLRRQPANPVPDEGRHPLR